MTFMAFNDAERYEPDLRGTAATLLEWMVEREQHNGLSVREIIDVSGLYPFDFLCLTRSEDEQRRYNECYRDLKHLQKRGKVAKQVGSRPITWAAWPHA